MTYDEMIDIINAMKRQVKLQKRLYNIPEKEWVITEDTTPDFLNYEYRIYNTIPKPAIVGLFFDGNKYFPMLITQDNKANFDISVKSIVKDDPYFRKWVTDVFYYAP